MTFDFASSREAVRRAGRATAVLLVLSLALLLALGAIFAHLMIRQNTLAEGAREDSLWAVYQLDRETRALSQAIDHLFPMMPVSNEDRDTLVLRFDILYSRLTLLETEKYRAMFGGDKEFVDGRQAIAEQIRSMMTFFDAIIATGKVDLTRLEGTKKDITRLLGVTENLLTHTNAVLSTVRADNRNDVIWLQRLSAIVVLVLAATIGLLLFNLMRQVKVLKDAAAALEASAREMLTAYEAAEAGNRAKSEFMAVIGHEIRTPLNGILGMAELLSHAKLGAEERANVGIITSSGTALLEMLNEILDFAKIEHGGMTRETVAFDVSRLVADATHIIAGRACERNNVVTADLNALGGKAWFMGDLYHVQRVLLNLLSNAAKFTENGTIAVTVSTIRGGLRFGVKDSGIGIAPEAHDRLFKAFSQVDSSISRRFGGTGLGRAICKRIIEELGGRIGVDSTMGIGSEFWFEVPMEATAPVIAAEPEAVEPAALPQLRVLVVEDMPVNRQVAAKFLARLGQQVSLAEDGAQGVAAAARESFDIILMDMQMPVMDGIAAARAIRATGNAVPIVAMTANASDSDRALCSAAGMNGFYAKPITLQGLEAALRPFAPHTDGVPVAETAAAVASDAAAGDSDIWNRNRIDELVDAVGEDGFSELVAMFEADLPGILAGLRAAIAASDDDNYDRALHALKGAAASVGLSRLARLAESFRHGPVKSEAADRISEDAARIGAAPLKHAA